MSGLRSGASGSRAVLLTSVRVSPHRARNSPPPMLACNLPKISKRYRATRRLLPTRCCCACGAGNAVAVSCWAILPQRFLIRSAVRISRSSACRHSMRAAHAAPPQANRVTADVSESQIQKASLRTTLPRSRDRLFVSRSIPPPSQPLAGAEHEERRRQT